MIGLHMDWALLQDKKVIFWFMTPVIQEIAQTVFELLGYDLFSVYSSNSAAERQLVQEMWNSTTTKKRLLFASAIVYGTRYNLQKDSRVGVLVDTPDTDNREKQIIGRQYRGGQLLTVHFFRLVVRGSHAVNMLHENLMSSLASVSAFIDYSPGDVLPNVPPDAPKDLVKLV
ncbi:hypothetical protein HRS9122_00001 [Pyrenophora teres f. teres]|nr:hypothetical protein HRS9122_00001 [Pyrenophora teres f. teres]